MCLTLHQMSQGAKPECTRAFLCRVSRDTHTHCTPIIRQFAEIIGYFRQNVSLLPFDYDKIE